LNIPWFETKTWWLVLNLTPVKNINKSSPKSEKNRCYRRNSNNL
jgi:hypothetical protein